MSPLVEYIREVLAADSRVDGPYTHNLADDESIRKPSALVPDQIKSKIFNYFDKMGLSPKRSSKKRRRRT